MTGISQGQQSESYRDRAGVPLAVYIMYITSEFHQKYVEKTTYNSKQARGLIFEAEMMSQGQLSPLGYVGTIYYISII
jgi:hypothetical protein